MTSAALFPILLGFVLTGVLGNWLIQRWQHRNWVNQQRFLRASGGLAELKKLIDEITALSDARNYRARRLGRAIGHVSDAHLEELRKDHDSAIGNWNDRWNSFCIGLTFYADYEYTQQLEYRIQTGFVAANDLISKCFRCDNKKELVALKTQLEERLNVTSGETFRFSRDLLNVYLKKELVAYEDPADHLNISSLELASTWQLFKALFKPL